MAISCSVWKWTEKLSNVCLPTVLMGVFLSSPAQYGSFRQHLYSNEDTLLRVNSSPMRAFSTGWGEYSQDLLIDAVKKPGL